MIALLLSAVLSLASSDANRADECRQVVGTYAIYANHDLLRIEGSRHFVEVSSAALDAELQRRGWEDTFARGRFTICGHGIGKPQRLNMQDQVDLRSWTDVRFERRRPHKRSAPTALSCAGEIGAPAASNLVQQCLQVSPATHPPCNAQNSCEMIRGEIKRGCDYIGAHRPSFCPNAKNTSH